MKRPFKLFLFATLLLSIALLSKTLFFKSSKPLAYASTPLCAVVCPAGTNLAGLPPAYGTNEPGQACQNLGAGSKNAVYCSFSGNQCTDPLPSLPNCTGITITPIPDTIVSEGNIFSYTTGSFTDLFSAPTATVDYGDGTGVQSVLLTGNNFSLNHTYQNAGVYNSTITISDVQGMPVASTFQVTVLNVAPIVGVINVDNSTTVVNYLITATATFTDPGNTDAHTAVWDWGDGNTTTGTITESADSGSVKNSHAYANSGVYTITLTVKDKGGSSGGNIYQYVSIYEPTQSFLTGSGKFNSTYGEVKFGLEAKYEKDKTLPKGKIEFNVKDKKFEFETTAYQWLAISGNVAYLQATGKVNDGGNYNIFLIAVDGTQTNVPDTIRIKLTEAATSQVVFDNELGISSFALPITQITKGSIKIHK